MSLHIRESSTTASSCSVREQPRMSQCRCKTKTARRLMYAAEAIIFINRLVVFNEYTLHEEMTIFKKNILKFYIITTTHAPCWTSILAYFLRHILGTRFSKRSQQLTDWFCPPTENLWNYTHTVPRDKNKNVIFLFDKSNFKIFWVVPLSLPSSDISLRYI